MRIGAGVYPWFFFFFVSFPYRLCQKKHKGEKYKAVLNYLKHLVRGAPLTVHNILCILVPRVPSPARSPCIHT